MTYTTAELAQLHRELADVGTQAAAKIAALKPFISIEGLDTSALIALEQGVIAKPDTHRVLDTQEMIIHL